MFLRSFRDAFELAGRRGHVSNFGRPSHAGGSGVGPTVNRVATANPGCRTRNGVARSRRDAPRCARWGRLAARNRGRPLGAPWAAVPSFQPHRQLPHALRRRVLELEDDAAAFHRRRPGTSRSGADARTPAPRRSRSIWCCAECAGGGSWTGARTCLGGTLLASEEAVTSPSFSFVTSAHRVSLAWLLREAQKNDKNVADKKRETSTKVLNVPPHIVYS